MILILRRFSKTVLEISVFYISLLTLISIVSSLLSSPAFIFSPSSPHSSLLQCSFFLAPNTTGFNTSLFYFFIFISSFIFILPFLSYLSRFFISPISSYFFFFPFPFSDQGSDNHVRCSGESMRRWRRQPREQQAQSPL